jgi:hypothetical protein
MVMKLLQHIVDLLVIASTIYIFWFIGKFCYLTYINFGINAYTIIPIIGLGAFIVALIIFVKNYIKDNVL